MALQTLVACVLGLALDLAFGDPRKMPHLVKFVGSLTTRLETWIAKRLGRTILSGLILWSAILAIFVCGYLLIRATLFALHPWLTVPLDAIVVFQSIAFKDLVKHIDAVRIGLGQSIENGRQRVSWIVGRDTEQMDHAAVCRATIESGAENYNDGAIGPLFWLVLTGPLGALIYRISNTLDAMIGHRNERYERLGKCAARIDDVLNFIPARICAFILCKPLSWRRFRSLKPDAIKHPSWNAGWPRSCHGQAAWCNYRRRDVSARPARPITGNECRHTPAYLRRYRALYCVPV